MANYNKNNIIFVKNFIIKIKLINCSFNIILIKAKKALKILDLKN